MNALLWRRASVSQHANKLLQSALAVVLFFTLLAVSNNGLATVDAVAGLPFPLEPGDVVANAPLGVRKQVAIPLRTIHSPALGVRITAAPAPARRMDLSSNLLGVFRGRGISQLQPNVLEIGQTGQILTVQGYGLTAVSNRSFAPATGITITNSNAATDGRSLTLTVDVAANAVAGTRNLVLTDATGKAFPDLTPQASAVLLRADAPRIDSITPALVSTGASYTITVRGANLRGIPTPASFQPEPTVSLTPATGLAIGTDVSANAAGTEVRFTLTVQADAPLTPRLLQIQTESGLSSAILAPNNTLRLIQGNLRLIESIVSAPLIVARPNNTPRTIELASGYLGVARGPVVTSLQPGFLSPGETAELTLLGSQLQATTGVQFQANTGLSIVADSLQVEADRVRLRVAVAADAPRTLRRVSVLRSGGRIEVPQLLEIRDAPPAITALVPTFVIRDGSAQTIQIQGQRLAPTTIAQVLPGTGLIIENYTVLSNTAATLRIRANPSSAIGPRLVKVASTNTASSDVRDSTNTLYIIDRTQILEPFSSPIVGVVRPTPPVTASPRDVFSAQVGVVRGPFANDVSPAQVPRGGDTRITISGRGLNNVSAIDITPSGGVTVNDLQPAADGNSVSARLNVAADATSGARMVSLRSSAGGIPFTPLTAGTITISNNQVNAPLALPDTYIVQANGSLSIAAEQGVLLNDVNPTQGTLFAVLRRLPARGVINLTSNGSFVYTPQVDFAGTDTFEYSAGSGALVGTATTVTLQIREPNDARDDNYGARDNELLVIASNIGLLANDTITTNDARIELQSQPTLGQIALAPDGSFEYTPNGNAGADRFRYRLVDGALRSLPAEVVINVQAVNEAPLAENDFYAVDRGRVLTVTAPGVLQNDRDPDRDPLTLRVLSDPDTGVLSLAANGGFTYTPPPTFVGQTSFRYEIVDPAGLRAEAEVLITVNDNLAPQPDAYSMNEGEVLFVDAPGLLANDSIIARGNLRILITQPPSFGTVQHANDGSFVYRPDTTERSGVVTFRYALQDDVITSSPVDVRITINAVNDPPRVTDDRYISDENAELATAAPGVLSNDSDIDSNSLTATLHAPATNGVVSLRPDGSFTYIPAVNYRGIDTFEYRAVDNQGAATIGTVRIEVTQPPTATNDVYLVDIDTPLDITDPDEGLLINDHDAPERDVLTAQLSETTQFGSLTLNADGTFRYVPNPGFSGIDTFSYQVTDTRSLSNVATVTLAVGITSLPRAYPDTYEMQEEAELIVPANEGLLINDTDADTPLSELEAYLVGVGYVNFAALDVTVNRDGSFRVRAPRDFAGETFFTYQIYDGTDISNTAIVTINVVPVNDGVDAVDDQYSVKRNTVFESNQRPPRYNDRMDDDYTVRYEIVTSPQFGQAEMDPATSLLRYTPQSDFAGADELTYRIVQVATGITDTATIRLRVNAAPITQPDAYTVPEDALTTLTPTMLANDTDPDGDPISYYVTGFGDSAYISVTANSVSQPTLTRVQTYNHFYGQRSIRYLITDGTEVSEGTINFTVTPVADNPIAEGESYLTNRDTQLIISGPNQSVLYNDFDPDARPYATAPQWVAASGLDLLPLNLELVESTRSGQLDLSPVGTFTYQPNTGFSGIDTFRYRVIDATGRASTIVTATIRVNSPAQGVDDAYTVNEDVVLNVNAANGVLQNDLDIDGDVLQAAFTNNDCHPCHGRVQVRADGSFVYTPDANFHGQDEFYYRVRDNFTSFSIARVAITVLPINDAPVTEPDTYRTREDEVLVAPQAQGILRNDQEVDGDQLVDAEMMQAPTKGTAVLNANGSFSYTPLPNLNGRDTFTYRVYDTTGLYTDEDVEVLLTPVNDAPTADTDRYQTEQDQALQVAAAEGLLANDRDVDGPGLVAALIGPPQRGRVTVNADGSFRYVPDPGFAGTDVFQYQIDDGLGALAAASAIVVVSPIASPIEITTEDDFYQFEGPRLIAPAPGVLGNDRVQGADTLTAEVVLPPTQGQLTLNPDGSFTFQAPAGFVGTLGFTYAAKVGAEAALAYVVLDVTATDNVPPEARGERFAMFEDAVLDSRSSGGVLINDADYENATLSAELVDPPSHGLLNFNANGDFVYRPETNFHGSDGFTYRAYDGQRYSDVVAVDIDVYAQNDAPAAMDDAYLATQDSALAVGAPEGLLANDADLDGDVLHVELIDDPAFGQVSVEANGAFVYQPLTGASGLDRFRYAVSDGSTRDLAEVSINVRAPGNAAPTATGEDLIVAEDGQQTLNLLANDTDPNGDSLIVVTATDAAHGDVAIQNGAMTYRPDQNFNGSDAFSYRVSDGELLSDVVVVTITVTPENDPPVAVTDLYQTLQAQPMAVPAATGVLANDTDPDSTLAGAALQTAPSFGTASLSNDGSFQYLPDPGFYGRDEFSYVVTDGELTAVGRVILDVTRAANQRPVAQGEVYVLAEDSVFDSRQSESLLANDLDADAQPLSLQILAPPTAGTLDVLPDGHVRYQPARDWVGDLVIPYAVSDGELQSAPAELRLTYLAQPDPPQANPDAYYIAETDHNLVVNVGDGLLQNDVDVDGDALLSTVLQPPLAGLLKLNLDGSFEYTPNTPRAERDQFLYEITDALGLRAQAAVLINMGAAEPLPDPVFTNGFE